MPLTQEQVQNMIRSVPLLALKSFTEKLASYPSSLRQMAANASMVHAAMFRNNWIKIRDAATETLGAVEAQIRILEPIGGVPTTLNVAAGEAIAALEDAMAFSRDKSPDRDIRANAKAWLEARNIYIAPPGQSAPPPSTNPTAPPTRPTPPTTTPPTTPRPPQDRDEPTLPTTPPPSTTPPVQTAGFSGVGMWLIGGAIVGLVLRQLQNPRRR